MTKILSNQPSSVPLVQEESLLNWSEVLEKFKKTFGNDIYESWIKNINLKKEFNHYIILSAYLETIQSLTNRVGADKIT